jgi:micrococcal nuclease
VLLVGAALLAGAGLNGGLGSLSQQEAEAPDPAFVDVVSVTDGDTIRVRYVSGHVGPVRYIGIDTPERGKCFSDQATEVNEDLVGGRRVRLVQDVERRDRYGRLLAYVYREDGIHVNAELVRRGYALQLTVPPNVRFAEQFGRLAREARERRAGLWKACR